MVSYTLVGACGGSSATDAAIGGGDFPVGVPTCEFLGDESGVINASEPVLLIPSSPSIDLLSLASSSSSSFPSSTCLAPISTLGLVCCTCIGKEVCGFFSWCDEVCLAK